MTTDETALSRAMELYEELGRSHRSAEFAAALISHRDRELAAQLRLAGHDQAARLIDPHTEDTARPSAKPAGKLPWRLTVEFENGQRRIMIANLLWLLFRVLDVGKFRVLRPASTSATDLNQDWQRYEKEATWN
ncbi:hypothetical protein [Streptomyces sp. MBT27]|uniref:hypothetical protein n=1 Tax=Streptomyces sp. MBT27 TaxID=1488356 RepID=UPI001423D975|nr:hypothetical protein [Streptomyces sp. MBT27]